MAILGEYKGSTDDWGEFQDFCKRNPNDPDCSSTAAGPNIPAPPAATPPAPGHCATPTTDSACLARGGTCKANAQNDSKGTVTSCLCTGDKYRRCYIPNGSTALPPSGGGGMTSTQKKVLVGGLVVAGVAALAYFSSEDGKTNQRAGGGSVDGLGCSCKRGRRGRRGRR